MKTTSYEISKKLKEIGFEAETFFFWTKAPKLTKTDEDRYVIALANKTDFFEEKQTFPAYHLETLLEALPKINKQEYLLCSGGIVYLNDYISVGKEKNESLADTAGRLLIELFEAGIINFKK